MVVRLSKANSSIIKNLEYEMVLKEQLSERKIQMDSEKNESSGDPGRISEHLLNVASSIVGNLNQGYQPKSKEQTTIPSPPPPRPANQDEAPTNQGSPSPTDDFSGQGVEIDVSSFLRIAAPLIQSLVSDVSRENKEKEDLTVKMMTCLAECVSTTNEISDASTQAYVFIDKLFYCYKLMTSIQCSKYKDNAFFNFSFKSIDKSICDQFKNALMQLSVKSQDCAD